MIAVLDDWLEDLVDAQLHAPGLPRVDFSEPVNAPALFAAESVTWRVMKNPVSLMVGGIAAVILELAEPRVRTGVWEHTSFRTDPVARMKRTGHAAMVSVYAPRVAAERMIANVARMHARVQGVTPAGAPYRADDPALLDWVQATASFGFLEAYCRYARALTPAERDAFYDEQATASALYGATGAPHTEAEMRAMLEAMRPNLEASRIVFEYFDILAKAAFLPMVARPLQPLIIAAAIAITPAWARELLGLRERMPPGGETLLRGIGAAAERIVLKSAPPAQACVRMKLPADYLYRRADEPGRPARSQ